MSAAEKDANGNSEGDKGHDGSRKRRPSDYWTFENTKEWVEMFLLKRMPIEDIASEVEVDAIVVSKWVKLHGAEVHRGLRRKDRDPPNIPVKLADLLSKGSEEVLKFLDERVWGVGTSESGLKQLNKFCDFVRLPLTVGLTAAAKAVGTDKTMITAWTRGTKQPYLVRVAGTALHTSTRPGWKLLPLWLESGGNTQGPWIQVPTLIQTYDDFSTVVGQLTPLESTYMRAARFGLLREQIDGMRVDLSSYLLGIMAGDATKEGGKQKRFTSSNIDLHLTLKQPTNERLGDFVCMCTNSLGIAMDRRKDKQPTGTTRFGKNPSAAYRWISNRSPLIAWMFNAGLGLQWDQCTTHSTN
jgi:hypothetical protein